MMPATLQPWYVAAMHTGMLIGFALTILGFILGCGSAHERAIVGTSSGLGGTGALPQVLEDKPLRRVSSRRGSRCCPASN
jgi:hypothetical protein